MRNLTMAEIDFVTGGTGVCTPDNSGGSGGNSLLGGETPERVGPAIIAVYEGLVDATSHIIERVANAL